MRVDCDGFEVETLINVRIAKAGLIVHEVPSYENVRLHGTSNLRALPDGSRVLRTIMRELPVVGVAAIVPAAPRLPVGRVMKIALVASSFLPEPGRLERRVDQLARGLAQRGAQVEVLTQGPVRASVQHRDGVTIRTLPGRGRPSALRGVAASP